MAVYLAFRTVAFICRVLPLRVSYTLARLAGGLAYYTWRGGRRRCVQNMLRVADGDQQLARHYARRSFGNYLVYLVDFFRLLRTDAEEIDRRVEMDREYVWGTLREERRGNGIVFITVHFGNWDMGAAILSLNDFPISTIVDSFSNERVDRMVKGSREHLGMTLMPADRMGPGILRALRGDNMVAVLVDIPQPEGGVEVEFFGDTISVPDGPARIALRTGSSVVAATVPRVRPWDDAVDADIVPVRFQPTGDTERDVRALTQEVFRHMEGLIRRDPSQWYIFRNLWVADRAARPA